MNSLEFNKTLEDVVQIAKDKDGGATVAVIELGFKSLELKIQFQQAEALERIANALETLNSINRIKQ